MKWDTICSAAAIAASTSASEARPLPLRIRRWLVCTLIGLGTAASAATYTAPVMSAKVVDADTGQPIEGVNVVAVWSLEFLFRGNPNAGDWVIQESVSSIDGNFSLPGWAEQRATPVRALEDTSFPTKPSFSSPFVILFKPGYKTMTYGNGIDERPGKGNPLWAGPPVIDWARNGKELKLTKWHDTLQAYSNHARRQFFGLGRGIPCHWEYMPRAYAALFNEDKHLKASGVRLDFPTILDLEAIADRQRCASVKDTLREFLK